MSKSKLKYTCTVDIDLPIDKVVALWDNENNFKEWQDGFKSIEHLSGTLNTKGATSKIVFQDKRKIELLETIISVDLPKEKIALYEHSHMVNTQTTRFKVIEENKTQYISEAEYTKFNGIMIKFKEQNQKWMNQFKEFAENKK